MGDKIYKSSFGCFVSHYMFMLTVMFKLSGDKCSCAPGVKVFNAGG